MTIVSHPARSRCADKFSPYIAVHSQTSYVEVSRLMFVKAYVRHPVFPCGRLGSRAGSGPRKGARWRHKKAGLSMRRNSNRIFFLDNSSATTFRARSSTSREDSGDICYFMFAKNQRQQRRPSARRWSPRCTGTRRSAPSRSRAATPSRTSAPASTPPRRGASAAP